MRQGSAEAGGTGPSQLVERNLPGVGGDEPNETPKVAPAECSILASAAGQAGGAGERGGVDAAIDVVVQKPRFVHLVFSPAVERRFTRAVRGEARACLPGAVERGVQGWTLSASGRARKPGAVGGILDGSMGRHGEGDMVVRPKASSVAEPPPSCERVDQTPRTLPFLLPSPRFPNARAKAVAVVLQDPRC